MITFEVSDMTCGHCVSTITKAVQVEDREAKVHIDLAARSVAIESATADAQKLGDAIKDVGYTPVVVKGTVNPGPVTAVRARSCCCG